MDEQAVSKLVTGKARRYLRTSTILLLLSLLVLSTFLVFVESQQQQIEKDFLSNENVHVIEVHPGAAAGDLGRLTFGDVERLTAVLDERFGEAMYTLTGRYELGFGIPDVGGTDRFLYGLDGDAARLLGLDRVEADTAYTMGIADRSTLELRVPQVSVTDGGMSSGSSMDIALDLEGGVSPNSPLVVLGRSDQQAVYVDGATFQHLVTSAFGVDWATFIREHDASNPFGVDVVRSMYLYVADLGDVRAFADVATELGFSTNFTLNAFDDLFGSLRTSARVGLLAILVVFIACLTYIFLNFNSYMNLAHRDMGILKHYGFSAQRVRRVFSLRIASLCRGVGVVVCGYVGVLGAVMLRGGAAAWFTALNLAIVIASVLAVYLLTTRLVVRRHAERDVLTLLKLNREFE